MREEGKQQLTGPKLDGLDIVVGNIVLDPRPVRVVLVARVRMAVQHLRDGAVAEETRGEGHLEAEPVAGLADVEDVARVGGAGLRMLVAGRGKGRGRAYLGALRWRGRRRWRCRRCCSRRCAASVRA